MFTYLSLGSNIEPREFYLKRAINLLRDFVEIETISSLYETEPWGNIKNQDKFLNLVIKGKVNLEPEVFLNKIKEIEKKVGRSDGIKWGPREIDIDIILFEDRIINKNGLTIPHKYFEDRGFVVIPLFEIDRVIVNPKNKRGIEEIYKNVDKKGVLKINNNNFKKEVYSDLKINLIQIDDYDITYFKEIDSTQKYLMSNFQKNRVVISSIQKRGVGRKGNEWFSNLGGLYFSFTLEPFDDIYFLPILTSYSMAKAIKKLKNLKLKIKIPNDIYLNNKKLCGIISESYFEGDILLGEVVGVGLNVNQEKEDFIKNNLNTGTSLYIETNEFYFLERILNNFFYEFKDNLKEFKKGNYSKIFKDLVEEFNVFDESFYVNLKEKKEKVKGLSFIDKDRILVENSLGETFEVKLHQI